MRRKVQAIRKELAADLAEITYEFPFRIPPYSALIIRAVSVLEGIALVANPQFAIIDEVCVCVCVCVPIAASPQTDQRVP